jgi:hypothetical protein
MEHGPETNAPKPGQTVKKQIAEDHVAGGEEIYECDALV